VREVNAKLAGKKVINAHDILCIRRVYSVQKDIEFCYIQNYATPRNSQVFIDRMVEKYEEDESFFNKTKRQFDQLKHSGANQLLNRTHRERCAGRLVLWADTVGPCS
jgi:hypothetical protein